MSKYPNLEALAQGCISGFATEWVRLRPEAEDVLAEIERLRAALAKHYEPLRLRAECAPGGFSESPTWCVICKGRGEPGKTIASIRHTPDCPVTLAAEAAGGDDE